jgi:hypothetical protein
MSGTLKWHMVSPQILLPPKFYNLHCSDKSQRALRKKEGKSSIVYWQADGRRDRRERQIAARRVYEMMIGPSDRRRGRGQRQVRLAGIAPVIDEDRGGDGRQREICLPWVAPHVDNQRGRRGRKRQVVRGSDRSTAPAAFLKDAMPRTSELSAPPAVHSQVTDVVAETTRRAIATPTELTDPSLVDSTFCPSVNGAVADIVRQLVSAIQAMISSSACASVPVAGDTNGEVISLVTLAGLASSGDAANGPS